MAPFRGVAVFVAPAVLSTLVLGSAGHAQVTLNDEKIASIEFLQTVLTVTNHDDKIAQAEMENHERWSHYKYDYDPNKNADEKLVSLAQTEENAQLEEHTQMENKDDEAEEEETEEDKATMTTLTSAACAANYDKGGSGLAPWATQSAQITSQQASELNAALSGGICIQTRTQDGCSPSAVGSYMCEAATATMSLGSHSSCTTTSSKMGTQGDATTITFSSSLGRSVRYPSGSYCASSRANSCFSAFMETQPQYLCPCGAFQFTWKAEGGTDWYEIVVAIKKDGKIVRTDSHRGDKMQSYVTSTISVSQAMGPGAYSVAFYAGSYDKTNGKALGAKLYVKEFTYTNWIRGHKEDGCDIPATCDSYSCPSGYTRIASASSVEGEDAATCCVPATTTTTTFGPGCPEKAPKWCAEEIQSLMDSDDYYFKGPDDELCDTRSSESCAWCSVCQA